MANIVHGGGIIDGLKYSNSLESITFHLENEESIFEIDVVRLSDSFGMAHDGKEKEIYDLDRRFRDITLDEFLNLRAHDRYSPINFCILNRLMNSHPDAKFILDIKEQDRDYTDILDHAISTIDLIHNIIPQVYCETDIQACIDRGFKVCIIGLWKNFKDIFTQECYDLIEFVNNTGSIEIFGFAVAYHHYLNEEFDAFQSKLLNHQIYFHGQFQEPHPLCDREIAKLNKEGYYFFV
jgi:hypothetical protein